MAGAVRTMPGWRAAWQCTAGGFVAVSPLTGSRAVLAVGTLATQVAPDPSAPPNAEAAHAQMRAVLDDRSLLDGHDPAGLFHRVNATLSATGLGRISCLGLLSRAGDRVPPAIAGVGRPMPLIVTPGGLSTPVEGTVSLAQGWTVILGGPVRDGRLQNPLLSPADVSTALALFSGQSAPGAPLSARSLLAVVIDG